MTWAFVRLSPLLLLILRQPLDKLGMTLPWDEATEIHSKDGRLWQPGSLPIFCLRFTRPLVT